MANHTQEQIDIIIQQIMDAEDPCTVTNQMVATVLLFLMDAAKEQPNLTASIMGLSDTLNTLLSGNANEAIESFNEVIAFLAGVTDEQTLTGLLLSLHNEITDKASKAGDGRLNPQETPVVMLDSMGSILDSVGSTTTVMHLVAQGDYIFSAGAIKYYKTYYGIGDPGNEVVILGPPQQGLVYCNKKTGLQYRWTGSDTGWVQVGGGRVINDLTTGGTIDALSAEMGKDLKSMIENIKTTAVDAVPVIDGFNSNTVLCAASARSVKILKDNVDAIMNALANMAFTDGRPVLDWAGQITQFTISIGSLTSGITVLHGTDSVTTPLTLNEGEVTLKLSANSMYLDTISLKDGSNNDVEFTRSIVDGYTVIKFILSSNVTLSATAVQGIAYTVQGAGISTVTGYAKPNMAEEITIILPPHYHWDGDLSATYGGTAITCNVTTDAAGNRVVTLPNNLSDTSKSIVITCDAAENTKITLSWSDGHMVVKKGNTPVTGSSIVVYSDEAPCSLTFEPADGFKWSSAPSANGLTFVGSGNYSVRTLTINSIESTASYSISAEAVAKSINYTIGMSTTPENFTATVRDMSDNAIQPVEGTISILEGNGVKIVLTPDTDYLVAISSVTMGGETLASEDYTVIPNGGIKTIVINQVTGNVVVTATATQVTKYDIYTPVLSSMGVTLSSGDSDITDYKAIEGMPLHIVLTPKTGQRITFYKVKMGSTDITSLAGENQDGSVTIDIASVDGVVDVDAVASAIGNHIVEHKLLNYTASDNNANTATDTDFGYPQHTVADNGGYQTTLSIANGAIANDDVEVLMGGKDITATAYNPSTGVVSIDHVIGDVTIIATAYTGKITVKTSSETSITINGTSYSLTNDNAITETENDVEVTRYYREITPETPISSINSIAFADKSAILELDFHGLTFTRMGLPDAYGNPVFWFGGTSPCSNLRVLRGIVINSDITIGANSSNRGAFSGCSSLVELQTVGWIFQTSSVYSAFSSNKFSAIDLEHVTALQGSVGAQAVFSGCTNLVNLRLNRNFFRNVTNIDNAFKNVYRLDELSLGRTKASLRGESAICKDWANDMTGYGPTKVDLSGVKSMTYARYFFKYSRKLSTVIIGEFDMSGITSANAIDQMFLDSTNSAVRKIVCTSPTPPKINTSYNWLSKIPSNWGIVVPDGCGTAYKNAPGWSSYSSRIKEVTEWNTANPNNQV